MVRLLAPASTSLIEIPLIAVVVSSAIGLGSWDGVDRRVVDIRDVDVDRTEGLIASATGACIAVVIDDDLNGVGVVAGEMPGVPCKILDVAGVVEVVVQVGQRPGEGPRCCAATYGDSAAAELALS